MDFESVFQRYELKYLLTRRQQELVLEAMESHMGPDLYPRSTVRSLYFDTDNYRLVRRSMERPLYKEKLRVRSYARVEDGAPVFVELKKKFDGVVYKRRTAIPEDTARLWLQDGALPEDARNQITEEIDWFRNFYGSLRPRAFLSCDRTAYASLSGDGFRVTFDDNVLCRTEDLSLREEVWGTSLLPGDTVLMEVKTHGSIPLWLTSLLTKEHIFRTTFSKYGAAYIEMQKRSLCYA